MFSTVSYDRSACYRLTMVKQVILVASVPHVSHVPYDVSCRILVMFALLTPLRDQNEIPLTSSCNKKTCCKYVDNRKRAIDTGLLV